MDRTTLRNGLALKLAALGASARMPLHTVSATLRDAAAPLCGSPRGSDSTHASPVHGSTISHQKLNRGDTMDIDTEGKKALSEYFASCSVLITSETPGFGYGTGVAVSYNNEDYILTAAHVLENEPENEKLLIAGRSGSPLKEAPKQQLPGYFFANALGKIKPSTVAHISIIKRLANKALGDITALKIEKGEINLPHTVFHDLSKQNQADISEGKHVTIFGYPEELRIPHQVNSEHKVALFPYCTGQTILAFPTWSDFLNPFDPNVDFFTDFTHDETTCNPKGMSGGGAWTLPNTGDDQLWAPQQSQLLGMQSGLYSEKKLLRLVRIEKVLELLSSKH